MSRLGIKCPECKHAETKVRNTRAVGSVSAIIRDRTCTKCGAQFRTHETVDRPGNPTDHLRLARRSIAALLRQIEKLEGEL